MVTRPGKLVVDPSLAPPVLPPDAAGNVPRVFDPEEYKRTQKVNHARNMWNRMVELEANARVVEDSGVAPVVVTGEDGKPQDASVVLPEGEDRDKIAETMVDQAVRIRAIASALISEYKVNELEMLASRIAELTSRRQRFEQELATWEELRDHPDHFGYVMLDGSTPIDGTQAIANCTVLEAALTDVKAELAYYESKRK